jgi:predicted alpha/beta superfamily hydrolase
MIRHRAIFLVFLSSLAFAARIAGAAEKPAPPVVPLVAPLVIGDTFTIESKVLNETRRINVYKPAGYTETGDLRVPVLYMPDGGMAEDFLHVAGLVEVLVGDQVMRPFLLVGIENTERRRDLTGPTEIERDKKIAPRVGGSEAFRKFLRSELMPAVRQRYRTTDETAIVGESLAGLFVVETLLREPDLFDTYIALDPSLWWNERFLVVHAAELMRAHPGLTKTLFMASSDEKEIREDAASLAKILQASAPAGLHWSYTPMPEETHQTIYHPAALKAFRAVLKP